MESKTIWISFYDFKDWWEQSTPTSASLSHMRLRSLRQPWSSHGGFIHTRSFTRASSKPCCRSREVVPALQSKHLQERSTSSTLNWFWTAGTARSRYLPSGGRGRTCIHLQLLPSLKRAIPSSTLSWKTYAELTPAQHTPPPASTARTVCTVLRVSLSLSAWPVTGQSWQGSQRRA